MATSLLDFVNFASSHRIIDEERKGQDRELGEEWFRTKWPGRPASYKMGSTQVTSLRISIFLLWSKTCFIATYCMAMGSRGQQPGMVAVLAVPSPCTLRPSVGERSHDGTCGALSWKVGTHGRKRRHRLRDRWHRDASLSQNRDPGESPKRPKETLRILRVEFFALVEFLATQDAWMTQLARFAESAEPRTN